MGAMLVMGFPDDILTRMTSDPVDPSVSASIPMTAKGLHFRLRCRRDLALWDAQASPKSLYSSEGWGFPSACQ